MQLMINIPDKLYETIKNDEYGVHQGSIYDSIKNGTPLPEMYDRHRKKTDLDIRPTGEWEFFSIGNNQYTRCSLCKDEHISEDTDLDWWYDNFKYCPKCGAKMIGIEKMDGGAE